MEKQEQFSRGIHPWVIVAENWDVDTWRRNLVGAPAFLIEAAKKIVEKEKAERDGLLERATFLPADSPEDYARYEMMADLCMLTEEALKNLSDAIEKNEVYGEPSQEGEIDWGKYYYV